ncbi:hypothetical protein BDV95DRAFT_217686 [Massariosphaeria phaeospora]|uniref:Uncharacterized protein n=1 Tax=Massariosphaeria phaeospora TaxID=100035 RepID=A0A7C8ME17_9PLEO|nr:hypothetical protein BDV95DRAFT_217686 [Massariosphaeria phaeospora]
MAAAEVLANRHLVSTILHHLSDMKYKDRRQQGPDQPVEFLEFRPTLVPCILVNRLWADEATSVLWKRYPHLPALKHMVISRRQYYANKIQQVFALGPPPGDAETLDYLHGLEWPGLKSLELEIDFLRHGADFTRMFHAGLEQLELSGIQSGDADYLTGVVLPSIFRPCKHLKRIRIGPDVITGPDAVHASVIVEHLDSVPTLDAIEVKSANLRNKDVLFTRLIQRTGLEALEIDLEPGIALLPLLRGPNTLASPFSSLKRLSIMCYPEIAVALPLHLHVVEDLHFDIARIPNQVAQPSDYVVLDDILMQLSHCPQLRLLKIGVGPVALGFPSATSFPKVSGTPLSRLALSCPKLEDVYLFATEPSAIDGSGISSSHFDAFCQSLPRLRELSLKFHPTTTAALQPAALQSLGKHCRELEVLRLKIPCKIASLPVPKAVPQIVVHDDRDSPAPEIVLTNTQSDSFMTSMVSSSTGSSNSKPSPSRSQADTSVALFPRLTHLALPRPETVLSVAGDSFTVSSDSHSASETLDSDVGEDVVRSWAHALVTHFPRLELLEAWGDWTGEDNESLNYFLPAEEVLATTWEFLSGIEQDLWDDENDEVQQEIDGNSWPTYDSGDDWDKASLINEYPVTDDSAEFATYDEESDSEITPGRTTEGHRFFEPDDPSTPNPSISHASPSTPPTDEVKSMRIT